MNSYTMHSTYDPFYDEFDMKHPFLSGVGSIMNIYGNYYSFEKYLSNNSDTEALCSDWENVGVLFLEAIEEFLKR